MKTLKSVLLRSITESAQSTQNIRCVNEASVEINPSLPKEFINIIKYGDKVDDKIGKLSYKQIMGEDPDTDGLVKRWDARGFKDLMAAVWDVLSEIARMANEEDPDDTMDYDDCMQDFWDNLRDVEPDINVYDAEELNIYYSAVDAAFPVAFKKLTGHDLDVDIQLAGNY